MGVRIRISEQRAPEPGVFGTEIGGGKPELPNMVLSVLLHILAIAILSAIPPLPLPARETAKRQALSPTEIRIGDRIYYVAELSADDAAAEPAATDSAPQAATAEKAEKRKRKGRSKDVAANLGAQAPPLAATDLHGPLSSQILIQPGLPPNLTAPVTTLPTFRVWTEQTPLVRKAYVTPGRQNPAPPGPPPQLEPPDLDLVHAEPAPALNEAKLILPRPPTPLEPPPPSVAPSGPQPVPVGDPVNVLSVSDRPQPAGDRLIVPPVQMGANGAVNLQPGARTPGGAGTGTGATRTSASQSASTSRAASGSQTAAPSQTASNLNSGAAKSGVKAPVPDPANPPISNPAAPNSASPGRSPGPSSPPSGAPGSNPASDVPGTRAPAPSPQPYVPRPDTARITQPRDGNYEVVVTQNAGVVPGSADFLRGRPVYSVYLHAGDKRDWILQYCLPPGAEPPRKNSVVIHLSDPAPLGAPYAVVMLRPAVTFAAPEIRYAMVHGIINTDGRFEQLGEVGDRALRNMTDVIQALSGWEFRPATKDGMPIVVEVLLCIPNTSG